MNDLKKVCKDALNLKIVSFFHEHPSVVDTARGIAGWLNHSQDETEKALDYLVAQKILNLHHTGSTKAYGYTQNKQIIGKIKGILKKGGRNV